MRWRFLVPVGVLALSALMPSAASATAVQILQNDSSQFVTATTAVAQTFTPASTARVDTIEMFIGTWGSGDTLTLSVFATSGGLPTGSALATHSGTFTFSNDFAMIPFTGLKLTGGTTYAVEAQTTGTDTLGGTCATSAYAGGAALFQSSGWVTELSSATPPNCIQDFAFIVNLSTPPTGTLDQQQVSRTVDLSNSEEVFIQTFTPSITGKILAVSLWVSSVDLPATNYEVAICQVAAGLPTCLGGASPQLPATPGPTPTLPPGFLADQVGTIPAGFTEAWLDVAMSGQPAVTAGTQYAIVWATQTPALWGAAASASSYGSGAAMEASGPGAISPIDGVGDFVFQVYMQSNGTPPPTVTSSPAGSGSDGPLLPLAVIASSFGLLMVMFVRRRERLMRG